MRAFVLSLLVGGSLAVIAVPSRAPSFRQVTRVAPTTAWSAERETARIRAHFDSVLAELGERSVGGLTSEQRARRATVIAMLRAYRDRGAFPRNYDFPGEATPYFVDRETGVLCAVAHLLESTGRRDIVDRVAAANNNVWVGELAEDAELEGWLREHGLTLEEAARIQVPYEQDNSAPYPSIQSQRRYESAAKLRREAERQKQQAALRDVQTSVTPLLSVGAQPSAGLAVQVQF